MPGRGELDAQLAELGIPATRETRRLLRRLATDSRALHSMVRRLSELSVPGEADLPDVDGAVERRMRRAYKTCTEPELLYKGQLMGAQNRRLLGILLQRIGEPVPLPELLLANGLRSATPRRLRELQTEHGFFAIETFTEGRVSHYALRSPDPDIDACAAYWMKKNIRDSALGPHARLIALLSAQVGDVVSRRNLGYVLPEAQADGKGRARGPQGALARRIRELRDLGYEVPRQGHGYVLRSLDAIPAVENIPRKVRMEVLKRDAYECQRCGWRRGMDPGRRPRQLEVHHRNPKRARPADVHEPGNLETLCSACHAGEEAALKKTVPRKAR